MSTRLPKSSSVQDLLSGLLGKSIRVQETPKAASGTQLVAEFETSDGEIAALFIGDLAFAARSGAALSLFPAARAETTIRSGKLEEALFENYYEVANVMTAVFRESNTRLILKTLNCDAAKVGDVAAKIMKSPAGRLDLQLDIPGYGAGQAALLIR